MRSPELLLLSKLLHFDLIFSLTLCYVMLATSSSLSLTPLTYHGGQNDYRPAFFISTSKSGKNNQDPAKDSRIPGNGHNDFLSELILAFFDVKQRIGGMREERREKRRLSWPVLWIIIHMLFEGCDFPQAASSTSFTNTNTYTYTCACACAFVCVRVCVFLCVGVGVCVVCVGMDQPNNLEACFPQDNWSSTGSSGKANDWRNRARVVLDLFSNLKFVRSSGYFR